MDKSWIDERDRFSAKYTAGVESFIQFSKKYAIGFDNKILCPCNSCQNTKRKTYLKLKETCI